MADGHRVTCIDDFSSGSIENLATLRENADFELLRHDVADALPLKYGVDEIYNLACPASPTHYQADPLHTMRTCVLGAFNALDLARRTGARVVQASTSEVYGDPVVHPQVETYTGNVLTTSVRAVTTKVSAAPRRSSQIIIDSSARASASRAFSILTDLA